MRIVSSFQLMGTNCGAILRSVSLENMTQKFAKLIAKEGEELTKR